MAEPWYDERMRNRGGVRDLNASKGDALRSLLRGISLAGERAGLTAFTAKEYAEKTFTHVTTASMTLEAWAEQVREVINRWNRDTKKLGQREPWTKGKRGKLVTYAFTG